MDEETEVVPALEEEEIELDLDTDSGEQEETQEEESVEETKARLAKAEELAENYKIRAEKAEAKAKAPVAPSKKADIDYIDLYALQQAQVPLEDVPQVVDYAKYKKISVADALKDNVVKTMLSDAQETRKTASVAHTGATRRGNQTKTPELIYEKAQKGELPETDEEFAALAAARISSGATSRRRA